MYVEESNRGMGRNENNRGLYDQVKTGMNSIGRDLNRSMQQVLEALEHRDAESAQKILARLEDLGQREDEVKEICIRILGRTNGNTIELRWTRCAHRILSLMGSSSGEIAAIAREIHKINSSPRLPIAEDLPKMGRMASDMLAWSIRTAVHPDAGDARRIMEEDRSLDRHRDEFANRAIAFVAENPDRSQPVVPYVLISRHLERIGDHASHIAEEVAYYLRAAA